MKVTQCFQTPHLASRVSLGLLLPRLVIGLAFMFHGYTKIQHPMSWMGPDATTPGVFQALASISEFGGGLAWILGLLTPLASFGIACTMSVALWTHTTVLHDPFVSSKPGASSFEPAIAYLSVALMLILAGPGRFSLDRLVFGEKGAQPPDDRLR